MSIRVLAPMEFLQSGSHNPPSPLSSQQRNAVPKFLLWQKRVTAWFIDALAVGALSAGLAALIHLLTNQLPSGWPTTALVLIAFLLGVADAAFGAGVVLAVTVLGMFMLGQLPAIALWEIWLTVFDALEINSFFHVVFGHSSLQATPGKWLVGLQPVVVPISFMGHFCASR